ncbi:MAG: thioredoxin family protein [Pyrinomonadaceae bacterium]
MNLDLQQYAKEAMSFPEYTQLLDDLVAENKTTGPIQNEDYANYTKLNRQRMRRLGKQAEINDELRAVIRESQRAMTWLVITEAWCGDAAQNIPVIQKIADESDIIDTRYILRDENPELMDRFLTNGARSIPVLVAFDSESGKVIFRWGPRPKAAMKYREELVQQGMEHAEISEQLQRWYNADKEKSLSEEFVSIFKSIEETSVGTDSSARAAD